MTEAIVAFGLFAALGMLAGLLATAPTTLLIFGFWTTVAGLAFFPPRAYLRLVARRNTEQHA